MMSSRTTRWDNRTAADRLMRGNTVMVEMLGYPFDSPATMDLPVLTEAQDPEADSLPPVTGADVGVDVDVDVVALTLLAVDRVVDRLSLAVDRAADHAVDHVVDRLLAVDRLSLAADRVVDRVVDRLLAADPPLVLLRIEDLTTAGEDEDAVVEVTIRTRHNTTVGWLTWIDKAGIDHLRLYTVHSLAQISISKV